MAESPDAEGTDPTAAAGEPLGISDAERRIGPGNTTGPGNPTDPGHPTGIRRPTGAERPSETEEPAVPAETALAEAAAHALRALAPENAGPGAGAFFDVDNTIMRGSSFAVLAKGMADRDYFTTAEVLDFTWRQLRYIVSGRENMNDITAATENGLQFVRGREPSELETLADEVYDERMVRRLWEGTIGLARAHLNLDHEVWLISATPVEISQVLARRLGLTGGLGTIAEVIDGEYTGRLKGVPLHGAAKAEAVAELASARGLDLSRCAAYSDSANDVPMLTLVGFPVAVNPDGRLRGIAKERGWPIVDHRLRGRESVRRGVPAAAAAGLVAGAAVGVAKAIAILRDPSRS